MVTGIICEYNPFHLGHKKQIDAIRAADPDGTIICLMSGNYVQRGAPAIVDKAIRARVAVEAGADLVLELPVTYSLRSAEGFAAGGVSILSGFCQQLCFGAENADSQLLLDTARILLSEEFNSTLRTYLEEGISFPAAREKALLAMGANATALSAPNNILAVEYCKAILSQKSYMRPMPILRGGDYHGIKPDKENPSATFLRSAMLCSQPWQDYVPTEAVRCYESASLHSLSAGERAILYRLRSMDDSEFEALPFGSEGLWRKLMHACRENATLDTILEATKSKRYTRSRLDRMILCAALGITATLLNAPAPYVRVLALGNKGRQLLRFMRSNGIFPNTGEYMDDPYQQLETRAGDLYGLFAIDLPESAGLERNYRVYCKKE